MTWEPIDLGPIWDGLTEGTVERPRPTIGVRTDGHGLFYPGRVNAIFGRYGSAKSYIAGVTAIQEIGLGMKVWWIDLEDNPYGMVERLIDFGVEKAVVLKCLRYVNPSSKLTPKSAREFYDAVAEDEPSLIVVDSAGEWGGLQGVKANIDEEIAQFGKAYIAPLARTGAAVVTIDHVGHEQKDPLRAAGSFRKMAAINGAAYLVEMVREMGRGRSGMTKLTCAKDRGGHYARGQVVAELTIDATTSPYIWTLTPPVDTQHGPLADEPPYVRRTLSALEALAPPVKVREVGDYLAHDGEGKPLKARTIQKALERLEELGYAVNVGGSAALGYEWALSTHSANEPDTHQKGPDPI